MNAICSFKIKNGSRFPMALVVIAVIIIVFWVLSLNGCQEKECLCETKCPKGQVRVIEDRGLASEAERCYTPGVNYVDYRPLTVDIQEA